MELPPIRGTPSTLNQRQNRTIPRQIRLRSTPLPRFSTGMSSIVSAQIPSPKLSSTKPITLPELTESLEEWQDLREDAQHDTAKERIMDCFTQLSDSLDLSFLSLSTLPDALGRMQHIQYLSIANNRFSAIPQTLTQLARLKLLNVSNNVLTEVPDSIKALQKLESFNGECNLLVKVSEELARLPKIQKVLLCHNRILEFPENIHRIRDLELEDQVPPASFADFSPLFAALWVDVFQHEIGSGHLEIWLARYEENLRLSEAAQYREAFQKRIGLLLNTMVSNSNLRTLCYKKAESVIATCHDGILFSLFEMEIKQVEERMIALELSDEEVRQETERAFNFYRLQELALLRSQQCPDEPTATTEDPEIDFLETSLFFYASPANTLEMPLGGKRLHFIRYPDAARVTHGDVANAVLRIEREKTELGPEFLIDFVGDKEFWVNYLENRYADIIAEHRQIFMDQMESLEAEKETMSEYNYLTQANGIAAEKEGSEQRLYRQLTRNIVAD